MTDIDEDNSVKLKATNTETTLLSDINEQQQMTATNEPSNSVLLKLNEQQISTISDDKCGCCAFKCKSNLANIKLFVFFMCLTVMLTNALTVGYRNSVVTTIERVFEISSIRSGILSGILEMGSLIATLLVSYFFATKNIPHCIAIASIICALGSFVYSIPHFISNLNYKTTTDHIINKTTSDLMCHLNSQQDDNTQSLFNFQTFHNKDSKLNCFEKSTNSVLFLFLIIANLLIGISSSPLYTLGTTYIDSHVSSSNSSVYLGFVYSMLAFGPVVGYLLGAALLRVYVNVFSIDYKILNITPNNSNWIGAWWLGFVILSVLLFFTSFPFFCFPRVISKSIKKAIETKYVINGNNNESNQSNFGELKNLPQAICNIVKNRVFMIVTFAFCCEITIISGFMTFLPKYIEHQFGLNNSIANIFTGGIAIPGACIGIVLGGFLLKRFEINTISAAKMAIISNIMCTGGIILLIFLGCKNVKMAGTTISYNINEVLSNNTQEFNLTSECNIGCNCSPNLIEPICGTNGVTYFSPCYAGCKDYEKIFSNEITSRRASSHNDLTNINAQFKENFKKCSCISKNDTDDDVFITPSATNGFCPSDCNTLIPFMIILFLITLFTSINQMPMIMLTLRSVTDLERPLGLALQLVIMRLLAYIPSPLIFGKVIDLTCLVWRRNNCEQSGSCLFYDREKFRYSYGSIAALYKILSTLLFVYLFIVLRKYKFKQKPIEKVDAYISRSINSLN